MEMPKKLPCFREDQQLLEDVVFHLMDQQYITVIVNLFNSLQPMDGSPPPPRSKPQLSARR